MKINKTSYEVWTYRDTNAVNMCVLTRNPTRQSVCSFSSFINLQEFDYYSWFFPIKYDTEQLLYLGIEWIDTGNKGSSEYTKGMLVKVQYIFMINARTRGLIHNAHLRKILSFCKILNFNITYLKCISTNFLISCLLLQSKLGI